ncbi:MAG: DUF4870 domain-containing protein [Vicingus serpentipes]|nr:DUF4870 domain-containing protein [Vicingus serpentipes]
MMDNVKMYDVPQPEDIPLREKEDAMGAYLMMFAALAAGLPLPIINLIAALIYFYVNKNKSRFVYFHSLQSLYSQIPTTVLNAVLVFWTIGIWFRGYEFNDIYKGYLIATIVANLIYFVFSLIAALKARKGKMYYFLLFGKIAYLQVFTIKNGGNENEEKKVVNQPPF